LRNSLLAVDWKSQKDEDINVAYEKWYSCFRGIFESHIPLKAVTICPRDKSWMNANVRRAIHKRNRLVAYSKFIVKQDQHLPGKNTDSKEITQQLLFVQINKCTIKS
jgi:hypothetical protein